MMMTDTFKPTRLPLPSQMTVPHRSEGAVGMSLHGTFMDSLPGEDKIRWGFMASGYQVFSVAMSRVALRDFALAALQFAATLTGDGTALPAVGDVTVRDTTHRNATFVIQDLGDGVYDLVVMPHVRRTRPLTPAAQIPFTSSQIRDLGICLLAYVETRC